MIAGRQVEVARALRAAYGSGAVGQQDDPELIGRFVAGSEAAFAALVERHGALVRRVALEVLGDRDGAEDVFQATFLVLARKARRIERPEALAAWLHGVAHRVASKARVQAARRKKHEAAAASRAGRSDDRGRSERASNVHDAVAGLPEGCRRAVVLCYFQGLTYDEAGRRLNLTEGAVRGRLARARRLLKDRLACSGLAWVAPGATRGVAERSASLAARLALGRQAPSAAVARLAGGGSPMATIAKWKLAGLLLALQVAAAGATWARPDLAPVEDRRPAAAATWPGPARIALTLDSAIDRLIVAGLPPERFEIPRSRADVLTAGIRANPAFYADAQLVPYGQFTRSRASGQSQDDGNVSAPPDLSRKREARKASAALALTMIEAQYQDAVRIGVAEVTGAFVEAQRARDLVALAAEGADAALARATGKLAALLNYAPIEAGRLDVVGPIDPPGDLPPTDRLVAAALAGRPDLAALRIGEGRARADLAILKSERRRYQLNQPYSIFASPVDLLTSPYRLTINLGVSAPAELADPNNRARSAINLARSSRERPGLERQVAAEVVAAVAEVERSARALRDAGGEARVAADAVVEAGTRFGRRAIPAADLLASIARSAQADRQQVEARAAHRRARLGINAAVGRRVVP